MKEISSCSHHSFLDQHDSKASGDQGGRHADEYPAGERRTYRGFVRRIQVRPRLTEHGDRCVAQTGHQGQCVADEVQNHRQIVDGRVIVDHRQVTVYHLKMKIQF